MDETSMISNNQDKTFDIVVSSNKTKINLNSVPMPAY